MARVGYYDMSRGEGVASQVQGIEAAGEEAVNVKVFDPDVLADLDVLVIQNPSNRGYGAEYLANLEVINQAVANGLTLIIHDRYVKQAQKILPGGEDIKFVRNFRDGRNIELVDDEHDIHDGVGGIVNDVSLDRGNYSSHGYAKVDSLPDGAEVILANGSEDQAVTFAFDHGEGRVIYSSIPLDYYLTGRGSISEAMKAYYANLIDWAAEPEYNHITGATPNSDVLVGTVQNDWIEGLGDGDFIYAGDGNDVVYGNTGNDTIEGGAGDDWLSGGKQDDVIKAGAGDDEVHGNTGNDTLFGEGDDDVLYGQAGDDRLDGGAGNNKLVGGSGNDVFVAGVGNDDIDGGSGSDTIDLAAATGGATVDLSKNAVSAGGLGNLTIKSVENVVGTDFADTIFGSKYANTIDGGDGNDWIRGKEGADILTGGNGDDTFYWERKDVADGDGANLGVDVIKDFDESQDTLDFTGLIKATKFDDISEVVSLEENQSGTLVSVYSGADAGVQQVVLLEGVLGLDVNALYDTDAVLA